RARRRCRTRRAGARRAAPCGRCRWSGERTPRAARYARRAGRAANPTSPLTDPARQRLAHRLQLTGREQLFVLVGDELGVGVYEYLARLAEVEALRLVA